MENRDKFDTESCAPPEVNDPDRLSAYANRVMFSLQKEVHAVRSLASEVGPYDLYNRITGKSGPNRLTFSDADNMRREYRRMVLACLKEDGLLLKDYPDFKEDVEAVSLAIRQNCDAYQYVGDDLRDNEDIYIILKTAQEMQGKKGAEKHASDRIKKRFGLPEE